MTDSKHPQGDPLNLKGKLLLDRYAILRKLATGGMSFVYLAQDERLQRPVCVKLFSLSTRDAGEMKTSYEHFVQEAFALSQLQHPNTLRIYDFGYLEWDPFSPFYVCEYLGGGTLSSFIRERGPLTVAQALPILEPIVYALSEAHARNIIHRDIKPSNILFGDDATRRVVKLADFGIAKALQTEDDERSIPNRAHETNARGRGLALFSPGWAAPEQIRSKQVGPYTDVFALGLLVAYMLSGRRVFSEDSYAKNLTDRLNGDAYVLEALSEQGLPPGMRDVLMRACRVKPSERFPTAEALLRAVRGVGAPRESEEPQTDPSALITQDEDEVPPLVLTTLAADEVLAAGRRIRLLPTTGALEVGGSEEAAVPSPARLRLTFLPGRDRALHLHVKGLNCFLGRDGARPTSGADLSSDTYLELRSPGREPLDAVRCHFGVPGPADVRFYTLGGARLGVPAELAAHSVLLDFGPGREAALVYSISQRRSDR